MSEIEIEKNVPLPMSRRNVVPLPDISTMVIGDSFFIPASTPMHCSSNASSRVKFWAVTHGLNWKFTVRKVDGGARVWRIK